MRQEHTSRPLAVLLERRRQGCWFAIELPPEVSGPAADATQQSVCLQLAVDAAFAPDNTGILAQEHMCLLWIPGAGVLIQTFQVPAHKEALQGVAYRMYALCIFLVPHEVHKGMHTQHSST